jgi:hypothetical protein
MVLKVATPGEAPQRRPNMEPRDIQWKIPMAKTLKTPRNIIVAKLVPIPTKEEIIGKIPRVMTLKSSGNPNHRPSMERLKRGKKNNFGYSA